MSIFGKNIDRSLNSSLDFLAIGDITIDAFIKLPDSSAQVTCVDEAKEHCELSIPFPDKIPFESMTEIAGVGNSANAAVSAARLGISAALITNVGKDERGNLCISELKKNNVGTDFVTLQKNNKTNYHYALWYGSDRTILIQHQEYEYKLPTMPRPPKWIYLSSLASNSFEYHVEIMNYINANPSIKLAFQPGTFQMKLGTEKLADLYKRSDVFIVNVEESQLILNTKDEDLSRLLSGIYALGPKLVLITDGPNGAYMYDGEHSYFMPIYPDPKAPYERTGCGDAFASTFISALILGKTPLEAFAWAPINSMSVVQHIGAQEGLLSRAQLEDLLAKKPANYLPTIYNSFLEKQS
jgi:sugar/nucleoside kinase (ribokinase family)